MPTSLKYPFGVILSCSFTHEIFGNFLSSPIPFFFSPPLRDPLVFPALLPGFLDNDSSLSGYFSCRWRHHPCRLSGQLSFFLGPRCCFPTWLPNRFFPKPFLFFFTSPHPSHFRSAPLRIPVRMPVRRPFPPPFRLFGALAAP